MWRRLSLAAALAGGAVGQGQGQVQVPTLYVKGATGNVEIANGRYDLAAEAFNGKHCYKKEHTLLWICLDQHNLWNFQPQGFLGSPQGIMVSTQKNADSPVGAGPWRVWSDNVQGTGRGAWVASSVQAMSTPDSSSAPMLGDSREMRLRQIVAGMLFGALILGMLVLSFLSSTDIQIRSYAYRLLGTLVTFLISFLFVGAVWDLLCKQLLPAPPPRGLGLGYNISPGIKVVLSFIFFTLCYFVSNVVGWKCQYRRSRLMVLRTLAAHITACWGICTFTIIQYEVVFGSQSQFQGLTGSETTKRALCFAVVVVAWYIFAVYRWASMGARQEYFKDPPRYPWPADSMPAAVPLTAGGRDTGCLGPWQTRVEQAAPKQTEWGVFLDDGEDEASFVTVGFLLAQAIMFCKTGELPGFRGHYTHKDGNHGYVFFGTTLLVLIFVFFLILGVRAGLAHGGRPGKIAQRTCAMAIAWMVYRGSSWIMRSHMLDEGSLAGVIISFGTSVCCFILMVIFDKVLDAVIGRGSVPSAAWKHLHDGGNVPLSESAMRGVMSCLGLIMALPWQMNVETSVMTLVQSNEFLSNHMLLARNLITIVLAAGMVYPWRRTLLPKSEMREASIGDEINHELMQLEKAENFMS